MSNVTKRIVSWANETDMKTITVGMLKDWILEMELEEQIDKQVVQAENSDFADVTILKLVYFHLCNELTFDVTRDVDLKQSLSNIINKMEDKNIENI